MQVGIVGAMMIVRRMGTAAQTTRTTAQQSVPALEGRHYFLFDA